MQVGGVRRRAGLLLASLVCLPLVGCGGTPDAVGTFEDSPASQPTRQSTAQHSATPSASASAQPAPSASVTPSPSASAVPSPTGSPTSAPIDDPAKYAVANPGPLKGSLLTADVLVTSSRPIPAAMRKRVQGVTGVAAVLPLSLASLSVNGRTLTIAAVDPGSFRRFTPVQSAQSDAVWRRVAGGEVAVDPGLPRKLEEPAGFLPLGATADAPAVHIGAYAPMVKQISAVVDYKRGKQLGIPRDNALLLSTGKVTPSAITGKLRKVVGPNITMQTLALEFNVNVVQTAVLSGSSVTDAVGTFSYTPHADGRVTPEASWVRNYIRTESVPILGAVTCNKGMLPQLRAALTEVVQRGLAGTIHRSMYGGCYYPRYIGYDPSKGLSMHTWGIAVDINVAQNQRGTVGQMDRRVVAIFKKWGFAWGGDWGYTDPMHFEMAKVVRAR
jgi:D-alanyl-D-alanine carboxypeptidase